MLNALISRLQPTSSAVVLSSHSRSLFTNSCPNFFRATPCLMAEPLKKKKRIDPSVIRAREERKKKKIEKQIRRLEKNSSQLKPIDELEVPSSILDTLKQRRRKPEAISHDEMESRALILKEWSRYKYQEKMRQTQIIDTVISSQMRALEELKLESEDLYQAALQIDESILPYSVTGPVHTPPIKDYDAPDGDYVDISRNWYEPLKFE